MHRRIHPINLTVHLPAADYRVYESAAKALRRIMRDQAPDVPTLIQSKLIKHDATGVVEDYLDLVGWPFAQRKVILPRTRRQNGRHSVRLLPPARAIKLRLPDLAGRNRLPADPSRN